MDRLDHLTRDYPVTLHWRPFMLRPDTPPGGIPLSEILPAAYLQQGEVRLREATAAAGLPWNRPDYMPNTHLAHEAGMYAEEHAKGDAFHRAVLRAYFGDAANIGDVDLLADLGASVGLNRAELLAVLGDGRFRDAVDRELDFAREEGISSVPTYVFAPGVAFSGAQPYDVFQQVMSFLGR